MTPTIDIKELDLLIPLQAFLMEITGLSIDNVLDGQQNLTAMPLGDFVIMTPTKQIYVGERSVEGDDAAIVSALRDGLAKSKQKVVILAGDREVVLGEVVRVLSLAKEAGASGFALASE